MRAIKPSFEILKDRVPEKFDNQSITNHED